MQTYNSFDALVAGQNSSPLAFDMSVFNAQTTEEVEAVMTKYLPKYRELEDQCLQALKALEAKGGYSKDDAHATYKKYHNIANKELVTELVNELNKDTSPGDRMGVNHREFNEAEEHIFGGAMDVVFGIKNGASALADKMIRAGVPTDNIT